MLPSLPVPTPAPPPSTTAGKAGRCDWELRSSGLATLPNREIPMIQILLKSDRNSVWNKQYSAAPRPQSLLSLVRKWLVFSQMLDES